MQPITDKVTFPGQLCCLMTALVGVFPATFVYTTFIVFCNPLISTTTTTKSCAKTCLLQIECQVVLLLLKHYYLNYLTYNDRNIGIKVALALCLGGNDFYPKSHQISHETVLKLMMESTQFRQNLFIVGEHNSINKQLLVQFYKALYGPTKHQGRNMSYDTVRALTIGKTEDESKTGGFRTNDPRRWLPPESAIHKLGELLELQIRYLETAGRHDAHMPNFLDSSCLVKTTSGEIEYNFGPYSQFSALSDLPVVLKTQKATKRQLNWTPQRGARRKRQLFSSTPKK